MVRVVPFFINRLFYISAVHYGDAHAAVEYHTLSIKSCLSSSRVHVPKVYFTSQLVLMEFSMRQLQCFCSCSGSPGFEPCQAALSCADMHLVTQISLQCGAPAGSMCDIELLGGIDKQCLSSQR